MNFFKAGSLIMVFSRNVGYIRTFLPPRFTIKSGWLEKLEISCGHQKIFQIKTESLHFLYNLWMSSGWIAINI